MNIAYLFILRSAEIPANEAYALFLFGRREHRALVCIGHFC